MLSKVEEYCQDCQKQFVVVVRTEDLNSLTCCPFCSSEIEFTKKNVDQDSDDE